MSAVDGLLEQERNTWSALIAAVRLTREAPTAQNVGALAKIGRAAYRTPIPRPRTDAVNRLFFKLATKAMDATTWPIGSRPGELDALSDHARSCELILDPSPAAARGRFARGGAFD